MSRGAKLLVVALGVVACGLLAAEVGGRVVVERVLEGRVAEEIPADRVEVVIGRAWWRPSLIPALLTGELDRIAVRLDGAEVTAVPVSELDYELAGISIDLSVTSRTVSVSSIERGTVRILVDPSAIGSTMGVEASVSDGVLVVGPEREPAQLVVDGSRLRIESEHLERIASTTTIPLPDSRIMPCVPEASVVGGHVELGCSGDRVPDLLASPLGTTGDSPPLPPGPVELEPPATLELDGSGEPVPPTADPPSTEGSDDTGG